MDSKGEEDMDLPPGFRFHPTDEELITHYLSNKVMDLGFVARAIGDVDLNKCEPWDLPRKAKMGENEWYFFCSKDRKYPTGLRTNRATESGYWKATGKDKEIYRGKSLVGMKKTLVFYKGRAPKGEKTNWVMHEYRLEGKYSVCNLPKRAKHEWVISRVFNKGSGGKKAMKDEIESTPMPPLINAPFVGKNRAPWASDATAHVTCFSNPMVGQKSHEEFLADLYYNSPFISAAAPSETLNTLNAIQGTPIQYPVAGFVQMLASNGYGMKFGCKTDREMLSVSQETGLTSDLNPEISSVVSNTSAGALQVDECLWNY